MCKTTKGRPEKCDILQQVELKSAKTADMQVRIPAAFLVCSADLLTAVSRPAD